MIRAILTSLAATATLGAAATASAQEAPLHWHLMAGYSEPTGTTSDYLQGGYMVGAGFTVKPAPGSPLDLRFDVSYDYHDASSNLLNQSAQATGTFANEGSASIWSGTGNAVFNLPLAYGVKAYGIAGIGVYHTHVELTQYGPFGYVDCDPFSGFCYGGGGYVVGSANETKFGWNAGAGLEFALPYGQAWFIEARYHRVNTDTPIEFVPITVGYRF